MLIMFIFRRISEDLGRTGSLSITLGILYRLAQGKMQALELKMNLKDHP